MKKKSPKIGNKNKRDKLRENKKTKGFEDGNFKILLNFIDTSMFSPFSGYSK